MILHIIQPSNCQARVPAFDNSLSLLFLFNMSLCRQNYSEACEAALNDQINVELTASYKVCSTSNMNKNFFAFFSRQKTDFFSLLQYLSLATHFGRDDVALPGFAKFYRASYHEEAEHAQKMIDYQNSRGGRVVFKVLGISLATKFFAEFFLFPS